MSGRAIERLGACLAVIFIAVPALAQAPLPRPGAAPARDAVGPSPAGTARIRGRVVQAGTTTPIRRAEVRLTGEQNLVRIVTTDGDGRYEISDLPAGRFTLSAAKGGYVQTPYGQRRPFEPGRPVVLTAGQVLAQVDIGLPRGAVIVGRVLDSSGEPVIGADVAVERYQYAADGQRRLTRAPVPATITDDRGAFRAFGLAPGEYLVSANVRQLATFPGAAVPGAPPVAGTLQTYYPGTPNAVDAQPVLLETGEEATVQFTMVSGRLITVSGTVLDSSGRPGAGADVMLATVSAAGLSSSRGAGSATADGAFSIPRVPSGEHFVQVRINPRPGGTAEQEMAVLPITAGSTNLDGLQVSTAPIVITSGRVEWEGDAPRTGGPAALRIMATPTDGRPQMLGVIGVADVSATGLVGTDNTFRLGGLSGSLHIGPTALPPQWTLKAVYAGTTDITTGSVDAASLAPDSLRVVLTDKLTEVNGSVRDAAGTVVTEFLVVVLPEERLGPPSAQRYTRAVRADQKGTFQIRGLPAGRYVVTAVPALEPGSEWDPAFQAAARNGGRRFTLEDGQTLALTVELLP